MSDTSGAPEIKNEEPATVNVVIGPDDPCCSPPPKDPPDG